MNDLRTVKKRFILSKGFYVYKGLNKKTKELVYIGTTVQIPKDRFRWHKSNGKDLFFSVINICDSSDEMLDIEFELIKKYKPKLNKITERKQNLNIALTKSEIDNRIGNKEWCQKCLKRRVKSPYIFCYNCK